jgi:hypothetical protein
MESAALDSRATALANAKRPRGFGGKLFSKALDDESRR